ncbi:MAG: hypothetical protein ACETWM_09485, partial [Candidatus Lokiarchaeia archaeon]
LARYARECAHPDSTTGALRFGSAENPQQALKSLNPTTRRSGNIVPLRNHHYHPYPTISQRTPYKPSEKQNRTKAEATT